MGSVMTVSRVDSTNEGRRDKHPGRPPPGTQSYQGLTRSEDHRRSHSCTCRLHHQTSGQKQGVKGRDIQGADFAGGAVMVEPTQPQAESESKTLEANEVPGTYRGNSIRHKQVLAGLEHAFTWQTYLPDYPFKIKMLFLETRKAYSKIGRRCRGFQGIPGPTHEQPPAL